MGSTRGVDTAVTGNVAEALPGGAARAVDTVITIGAGQERCLRGLGKGGRHGGDWERNRGGA
jgi:hypothetical protein